jgi:hypothetical protein
MVDKMCAQAEISLYKAGVDAPVGFVIFPFASNVSLVFLVLASLSFKVMLTLFMNLIRLVFGFRLSNQWDVNLKKNTLPPG